MNIWQYQAAISKRLMRWAQISIATGVLMRIGGPFWRGVGGQFVGWGLVDAMIAFVGQIAMRNRIDNMENPGAPTIHAEEADKLKRLLWLNAGLDILYVLGGLWLLRRDQATQSTRGAGLGVIIQGAFLFIFDILHALRIPRTGR